MLKKIFILIIGLFAGLAIGYLIFRKATSLTKINSYQVTNFPEEKQNQVIGFLPYWLIPKANKEYSKYLTTLTYFSLTINPDGTIKKLDNPVEEDPGWYSLHSGKTDSFLNDAKRNNIKLSLLVFNADEETISQIISDPVIHAQNLVTEVAPVMKQYGFTDLNLDIESTLTATDEARNNFTIFTREVKKNVEEQKLGTLTVDVSPIVLFKKYLVDINEVGKIADSVVFMTYDFHYPGSFVTGPVSPVGGAGKDAEFDSEVSIKEALNILPAEKILLGAPLYGYEWETIDDIPRSAVIPGTGLAASNRRVEEFLQSCATCSAKLDNNAKESYTIYKDEETGTFHQIFYPDEKATEEKIKLAKKYKIGGLALWALGYEGETILNPLEKYKKSTK